MISLHIKGQYLKPVLAYPSKTLDQLCLQTGLQLSTLEAIQSVLPNNLKKHALHCVQDTKTLTVYTDSANWAAQLRFYGEAMLAAANNLKAGGKTLKLSSLRVKIRPPYDQNKTVRKPIIPNEITVEILKTHGDAMTDPQLKTSLSKLSTTLARLRRENANCG